MRVFSTSRLARCAALLVACAVAAPVGAAAQSVTVVVNGQAIQFDQPPVVQAGRVFVPLRGVFERLGASVVYSNGQINATAHGTSVSLTIGSLQATVAGRPETLDVAPFLAGERTLVPLRFVASALGASVNWNDSTSTVTISAANRQPGAGGPPAVPPSAPAALVYHWPTGTIYNHEPQLRFELDRQVRPASFQASIDGTPVNVTISRGAKWYYFAAPRALPMGNHTVRVRGRTQRGDAFDVRWTFYQAAY